MDLGRFLNDSNMLLTRLWWTEYKAYHLLGQARYPYKPLAAIYRDQNRHVRAQVAYAYRQCPITGRP